MRRSHNEIVGLITKAARGAGFSSGTSDDIGRAAGWLCAAGLNGVGAALAGIEPGPKQTVFKGREFAPAFAASHLSCAIDLLIAEPDAPIMLAQLDVPELALGLIGVASQDYDCTLALGGWARVRAGRVFQLDDFPKMGASHVLSHRSASEPESTAQTPPTDITVSAEIWDLATRLAAKTYVPATSMSRSGAGADINDNE